MKDLVSDSKVIIPRAAAGLVILALAVAGLVQLFSAGFGVGWHWIGVVSSLAGAMVVAWLGWYVYRLTGSVTSIAQRLSRQEWPSAREQFAGTDSLIDAIKDRLAGYERNHKQFEEQLRELHIQLQLAQRQKQNTDAIIYSIRDAVLVVDDGGRLAMANEAAGALFGFNHRQVQHSPVEELIKQDKKAFFEFLNKSRKGKNRATRKELEFIENDRLRTFDCIVSCVYDQREQVCGAVAVLHDITREKEIAQMKNDFVSHVSHELRTPLASITAYSEMLADGEADDEKTRNEFYGIIQNQANRLTRLIDDILNTARIESGLIKVDKKPLSMTILIQEQLGMIQSFAEEKNIEVIGQEPIVFDQAYVDHDMMAQVVINLLSNAVKYTPSGGKVSIRTEVDDNENTLRVEVADTGVGIPPEDLEHLFEKFFRVKANNKQAKGTGLGLNLVKQIVEKVHNGKVFVTSEVGKGSTFGFELPLATNVPAEVGS